MICSMTDLILDNVVCYNRLLYICDIGFYPGLEFGLGLDSRGRGQTLEAEAEAEAKTLEAEAEAGDFGFEAEARPRGLTSLTNAGDEIISFISSQLAKVGQLLVYCNKA